MKLLNKILGAAFGVFLSIAAAYGQNATVTNHAFAIGRGPQVSGYTSLLCGAGQLAVAQAGADPICRTVSGDWTLNAAGVSTLATVNANVGSFGSASNCVTITVNAKGLITAASQIACTAGGGGITQLTGDATAGPGSGSQAITFATVNGNVGSFGSATQCTAITVNAKGLITAASQTTCTPSAASLTGTLQAAQEPAHTGDVTNSAGSLAMTLATVNGNVGTFGSATQCTTFTVNGKGLITAASQATCAPTIGNVAGLGANVATAAGNALSAAGGLTTTVASGTLALTTTAIGSAACTAAQTATATNATTSDVVLWTFASDPTAVTGYAAVTTGMLTIIPYATTNLATVKVCNLTASSITPGAITLNWRVVR